MTTRTTTTRTLSATLCGQAWGGFDAAVECGATLKRGPLAPQLDAIKQRRGGDFQREGLALVGCVTLTRTRVVTGPRGVRVVQRQRVLPVEA